MPDNTTLSHAARLLSPQLLQDARSDTARRWAARALCAGVDPEVFFPPGDDPAAKARGICGHVPVRGQCLAYAVTADEPFGIWGGLDPRQRHTLRRRLQRRGRPASSAAGPLRDPGTRRLRARIAANARWSRPMARADQADAARTAMTTRLEREVDPAGQLQPDQRAALTRAAARRLQHNSMPPRRVNACPASIDQPLNR